MALIEASKYHKEVRTVPQPYNYTIQQPNYGQSVTSGLQAGLDIRGAIQKQQQERLAQVQQAQYQKDLAYLHDNISSENITKTIVKYPQLSKSFENVLTNIKQDEKDRSISVASKVYAALSNGSSETAKSLLEDEALALENSGDSKTAKTIRDLGRVAETSPETAKLSTGLFLAASMGNDKFLETFKYLDTGAAKSRAETQEAVTRAAKDVQLMNLEAEAAPVKLEGEKAAIELSKANAKKVLQDLQLDQQKIRELPAEVKQANNDTIKEMKKTVADFHKANDLFNEMPSISGGTYEQNMVALKKWWSGGSKTDAWRQRLEQFKLVDMLRNKPPGALSEGELNVLKNGVPDKGAGPEVIKSYLDATKKAINFSYAYDRLSVKFREENKYTGSALKDFQIFDEQVNKGETLDEFVNRLGPKSLKYGIDKEKAYKQSAPSQGKVPSFLNQY